MTAQCNSVVYTGSYCVLYLSRTLIENQTGVIFDTYGAVSIDKCIFRNNSPLVTVLRYWQEVSITNSFVSEGRIFSLSFSEGQFHTTNTSFHNCSLTAPARFVSEHSTFSSSLIQTFTYISAAEINSSILTDSTIAITWIETLTISHSVFNNTLIQVYSCDQIFINNTQLYSAQVFLAHLLL